MTPSQARVLRSIKTLTTIDGVPPSFRQLSDNLRMNLSSVHRIVGCLERDGKRFRVDGPRGIRLPESHSRDPGLVADAIIERMDQARAIAGKAGDKFTKSDLRKIIVGVLAQ